MSDTAALQMRALAVTKGTRLGAILAAAFEVADRPAPAFQGKAVITSDGFVMCDFADSDGRFHRGAFVGDVTELERNLDGLSKHLRLDHAARAVLLGQIQAWIDSDFRSVPGLRLIG
jgi:hypothetical protein